MNTISDFDRRAAAWLADGPTELNDRVLDAALREVHLTHQRRRWAAPRRIALMSLPLRAAAAIAALAVAGIVGLSVLGRPGIGTGSPAPSTSASVTSGPTLSPAPAATNGAYDWPGPLAAGSYTTKLIWITPVTVTFTVPEGWESRDVEVFTDPVSRVNEVGGPRGRSLMFALVNNVYADPCAGTLADPPVAETVDALADALADLPGVDATAPSPVTLAGYSGRYVEFTIREDAGCPLADFHLWQSRADWMRPDPHSGGPVFKAERERYRVWVLDVDGVRYLIAAIYAADVTAADEAEIQAVIDSIELSVDP